MDASKEILNLIPGLLVLLLLCCVLFPLLRRQCLKIKARRGDRAAQFKLATIYFGVFGYYTKAAHFFNEADKQDGKPSHYDLAVSHFSGKSGTVDNEKGLQCLLRGAEQDELASLCFLTGIYSFECPFFKDELVFKDENIQLEIARAYCDRVSEKLGRLSKNKKMPPS